MTVPILGQKKPEKPPLMVNAGPGPGGSVIIDMCLMEVDHRVATITPQDAFSVAKQIGNAIEQGNPGSLQIALQQWLDELAAAQRAGDRVLKELKMA
jgi:hypothetical protein